MTDNTQADDAWKSVEENPERLDASLEEDDQGESLNRREGQERTTTGGASLSELMQKL